jgi:hypothetical protein
LPIAAVDREATMRWRRSVLLCARFHIGRSAIARQANIGTNMTRKCRKFAPDDLRLISPNCFSGKKDVRTIPGSSALFRDVFLRLPEVIFSLQAGDGLSDHLVTWLHACARACYQLAEFEFDMARAHDTDDTASDLMSSYLASIQSLITVFNADVVKQAVWHADGMPSDEDGHDGGGDGDGDDDGGGAPPQQRAETRSLGQRLIVTPKVLDAAYLVLAAQTIAPYDTLMKLGAFGELGHQSVKAVAKKSGRRDELFVKTVLAADVRRWWLRRDHIDDEDAVNDESRRALTAGNVLPNMEKRGSIAVVPFCVEQLVGGAQGLRELLVDHSAARLRGIHVDSHRFYTQAAIDSDDAEASHAPLLHVRAPGDAAARFGVLVDVIAMLAHGKRGATTQKSGRTAARAFVVLAEYEATGTCKDCGLARFRSRRNGTFALELKPALLLDVLSSNDRLRCARPISDAQDTKVRHVNGLLQRVKSQCRGW